MEKDNHLPEDPLERRRAIVRTAVADHYKRNKGRILERKARRYRYLKECRRLSAILLEK